MFTTHSPIIPLLMSALLNGIVIGSSVSIPLILFKSTIFAARFIKSLRSQKHIKIFVMNTVFTPIVETTPLLPKLHISLLKILWILQKNILHLLIV